MINNKNMEKIKNIVDYLVTHNKNYNKQQYYKILELQDILNEKQEEKPKARKKVVFEEMEPDDWAGRWIFDDWDMEYKNAFIWGNSDFKYFGIDETIQNIIDDSCNNDEILENLKKETGQNYKIAVLRGYSQGDWQNLFYIENTMTAETIKEIESFYFGLYREYFDTNESVSYIVCDYEDDTKAALAEQAGLNKDDIIIKQIIGYTKTPVFEEE